MPPQQYPQGGYPPQSNTTVKLKHHHWLLYFVITFLLLLGSLGFGAWAFAGREDFKNNVDDKIDTAVKVARQQESSKKDAEFLEREKSPFKSFVGPDTYGSLTFKYPKTWSAHVIQTDRGTTPIEGYLHPNIVPAISKDTAFALRFQVINRPYADVLKQFDSKVKSGKVKVKAFTLKKVSSEPGSRLDGEINTGQQDSMILLPLRDKTIQVWTESQQKFGKDFDTIILPDMTFAP